MIKKLLFLSLLIGSVSAFTASSGDASEAKPMERGNAEKGSKLVGTCVACHGAGIAGAPRVGDKAAWVHRIAQGTEIIYEHALNGFQGTAGIMPAKGGFTHLSDEEVKAAIDFMIEASK